MAIYQESACNACPVQCRAGVFAGYEHNGRACPAGKDLPDWRTTSDPVKARASIEVDLTTTVTAVRSGTMLVACSVCGPSCPCLLEVTGPVDSLPCILLMLDKVAKWHRVTG